MHADVLATHSWSTNVCGEKHWYFVRRGFEEELDDKNELVDYLKARDNYEHYLLEVHQRSGETVFVPSNWYHQVHNVVRR